MLLALVLCLTACQPRSPFSEEDYIGPARTALEEEALRVAAAALPPTTQPTTRPATQPATQPAPLVISIHDAVLLALENNIELQIRRLNPPIRRTQEELARSLFDPVIGGEISAGRTRTRSDITGTTTVDTYQAVPFIDQFLPTGTTLRLSGEGTHQDDSFGDDPLDSARVQLSATQALLRGFGLDVNLAALRQARLDTRISQYELRAFAEALIADVETAYWNHALAEREVEIVVRSLDVAQQQLERTRQFVRVGKMAQTELAAPEAEVASRQEDLIDKRALLEAARLLLLRLLNPGSPDRVWQRGVVLQNAPFIPGGDLDDVEAHAALAMRLRPDLNQARLLIQRGELELVRTRNGLLPRLDLFARLGKTGFAESFGRAVQDLDSPSYDALAGVSLEYPLGNRAAEASHNRALISQDQAVRSLGNLAQLAQVDVRIAYLDVQRTRQQIEATAATRRLQQEKLRAETEKFRVGTTTNLQVAQAQRDLLNSEIEEIRAVVGHLNALVDLYRFEGSLLERRGIQAPGNQPPVLAADKGNF